MSSSSTSPILSHELRKHYARHGVVGLEDYINQGQYGGNGDDNDDGNGHHSDGNKNCPTRSAFLGEDSDRVNRDEGNTNKSISKGDTQPFSPFRGNRFIRLNPRHDKRETLDILTSELPQHLPPIPVSWLSEKLAFYAIPSTFSLVKSKSFQEGRIYGMDVSSGAAVAALLLNDYDRLPTKNVLKSNDSTEACRPGSSSIHNSTTPTVDEIHSEKTSFRVLDLCCAPGLKTCAIADLLSSNDILYPKNAQLNDLRIIGVDISEQRMQLCKKIIQKYHIDKTTCGDSGVNSSCHLKTAETNKIPHPRIRLYHTDGTTFGTRKVDPSSLIFDSHIAIEEEQLKGGRKRMNKSARARQKKKLQKLLANEEAEYKYREQKESTLPSSSSSSSSPPTGHSNTTQHDHEKKVAMQDNVNIPLFDRVLVDAECSTDGAVRHLQQKHKKSNFPCKDSNSNNNINICNNKEDYANNYKLTDKDKLAELVDLQKRLIHSGYKLLKPGGVLLYSTCSLAVEQNEEVVAWLLELYSDEACIIPVSFRQGVDDRSSNTNTDTVMIYEGSLNGTVRFHPNVTIAKEIQTLSASTHEHTTETNIDQNLYGGGFFLAKIRKKAT